MQREYGELKRRLAEINDLTSAANLLSWDQSTYMPAGGAPARARQLSTLGRLAHEMSTDPALGRLLDRLEPWVAEMPYEADEAALVRLVRRNFERLTRLPTAFVSEAETHFSASFDAWTRARPADDFAAVQPYLEKSLDLSRRYADFFPGYQEIIDPLIDITDHGMEARAVGRIFAELRQALLPLVGTILDLPPVDDSCLRGDFPEERQRAFGEEMAARFGYDFARGRQDKTHHPFMVKFSLGDVRITTRFRHDLLSEGLFSTLHETGHALYEQGIAPEFEATPLARGTSAGVHESSSRLWENQVGRSLAFWHHFFPHLQTTFADQLGAVSLDTFYRAINKVQASTVRTAADELTYNLHVMMRFDFERALLDGRMTVEELPEAWRERMAQDLGVAPADDRDGVLQDVHWFSGYIGGAFQGYTLGNILSAQFYSAASQEQPSIEDEIRTQGTFDTLRHWLTQHVYRHGSKFTAEELTTRATGRPLTIEPYVDYLRGKYNELYALSFQAEG